MMKQALPSVVLALDASTYRGSVVVVRDGVQCAAREPAMKGADAERLMPAVAAALDDAGATAAELSAIVCGGGPGSFTSLRIAAAIAKGLATVSGARVYAMPSLALVALADGRCGRILATSDAMRGDRYAALVTVDRRDRAEDAAADGAAGDRVVRGYAFLGVFPSGAIGALAMGQGAACVVDAEAVPPVAAGVLGFALALPDGRRLGANGALVLGRVPLAAWEPDYGRQAEAQVTWEATHGRTLPSDGAVPVAGIAVEAR
jgi:tRNA threonylcarbamoyladenosine biosynthesis protein TsaB